MKICDKAKFCVNGQEAINAAKEIIDVFEP